MPVRSYRSVVAASIAVQAMLAFALVLNASAALAQQVVLNNTRSLDFGRFVAGTGGTITLSPTGLRSRTGGVILLNSPNTGQAAFSASRSMLEPGRSSMGATANAVIVSVPANGATRLASGANGMAVGDFFTPDSLLSVPTGGATLSVGATLVVAPNQAPGTYSGSFSLIVNYQ